MFKKILSGIFILAIIITAFIIGKNTNGVKTTTVNKQTNNTTPTNTSENKIVGCTRTTRLENEPQYDRALSLIKQRLDDRNKTSSDEWKFKYFPIELTNCIKVTEADLKQAEEGFFIFNSKDIKPNYYPITADKAYHSTDDISSALLLVHEMTHVQQYIDTVNGKDELSCIDKEVGAFMAQYDLYESLNAEEFMTVYFKRKEDDYPNLHPQLKLIKNMIQIDNESGCKSSDKQCTDENMKTKLKRVISEDVYYKKQCKLQ